MVEFRIVAGDIDSVVFQVNGLLREGWEIVTCSGGFEVVEDKTLRKRTMNYVSQVYLIKK